MAVANFIYQSGVPFNVINSKSFTNMVDKIAAFGTSYKHPSDHPIRTSLLEKQYTSVEERLNSTLFAHVKII